MEWNDKYRPRTLKQVYGQDSAVRQIQKLLKDPPRKWLICGSFGNGKTTLSRILAYELMGLPYGTPVPEFDESNSANRRGIADAREIIEKIPLRPMGAAKRKVYLFDEAHKLTPDAVSALLKVVEETPEHVVFIFTTNHPEKLSGEMRSRLALGTIVLEDASQKGVRDYLLAVAKAENVLQPPLKYKDIFNTIAQTDSFRTAVSVLQKVAAIDPNPKDVSAVVRDIIRSVPELDASRHATEIIIGLLQKDTTILLKALDRIEKGSFDRVIQRVSQHMVEIVNYSSGIRRPFLFKDIQYTLDQVGKRVSNKSTNSPGYMSKCLMALDTIQTRLYGIAVDPKAVCVSHLLNVVVS